MKCPFCGKTNSKVIDSRPTDENSSIRRRRECLDCANRFTTYEVVEEVPILVIKKNGTREVYDRGKVLKGIVKACESRSISYSTIEGIVDSIDRKLSNSMVREIDSTVIGSAVMDALKEIDEVAYVRFASVYRNFKDINTFMDELEKLMQEKNTDNKEKN